MTTVEVLKDLLAEKQGALPLYTQYEKIRALYESEIAALTDAINQAAQLAALQNKIDRVRAEAERQTVWAQDIAGSCRGSGYNAAMNTIKAILDEVT